VCGAATENVRRTILVPERSRLLGQAHQIYWLLLNNAKGYRLLDDKQGTLQLQRLIFAVHFSVRYIVKLCAGLAAIITGARTREAWG